MFSLKGKIVLITGASSGIGKACAEACAAAGAKIILTARRIDRLKKLSVLLKEKYNTESVYFKLDIRNREEVDSVIGSFTDEWKPIDLLINNAGLSKGVDKIHESETQNWETMIDTNVKGLLYISKAVIPGMVERGKGHIINLSSIAGHQVYHGGNVYCATKHAVNAITQAMQIELVDTPVRVSAVSPGMVETEFSIVRYNGDKNKAMSVYAGIKPLTAEDIADAVIYCATRPQHVNINDIIIMPTHQANVYAIHRDI